MSSVLLDVLRNGPKPYCDEGDRSEVIPTNILPGVHCGGDRCSCIFLGGLDVGLSHRG